MTFKHMLAVVVRCGCRYDKTSIIIFFSLKIKMISPFEKKHIVSCCSKVCCRYDKTSIITIFQTKNKSDITIW